MNVELSRWLKEPGPGGPPLAHADRLRMASWLLAHSPGCVTIDASIRYALGALGFEEGTSVMHLRAREP